MKHLFFILLILITFSSFAQKHENYNISVNQISDNFFLHTSYKDIGTMKYPSNGAYIITENNVILLDTPWDSLQTEQLLSYIEESHNLQVSYCIITHFHDDRNAGVDILKSRGVKTYSSNKTNELSETNKAEFIFKNDTTFNVDNLLFETYYPGKGHTADNILVWFPEKKILYAGCFSKSLNSKTLGNVDDAFVKDWSLSIKKTISKFPEITYVIPGHYEYGGIELLKHTDKLIMQYLSKQN